MGNELEDLQDEVEGWNRRLCFDLLGAGQYWLAVQDGCFTTGDDSLEDVDLILTLDAAVAARIFAGETDAESAFTSGSLRIEGDLPDAIKVQELLELVAEEIEY